jgi:hypothetical protein
MPSFFRAQVQRLLDNDYDHLEAIAHALAGKVEKFFTLHGRMSKKQRALAIDALNALQTDSARVLLAADFGERDRRFRERDRFGGFGVARYRL